MKVLPYVFLIVLVVLAGVCLIQMPKKETVNAYEYEYFRIHINANSNSTQDQQLKYVVKSKVVEFLTPYLAEAETKEKAIEIVSENVSVINAIVENTLSLHNKSYKSETLIKKENFPTRYYENCLLEAGEYDAIVITLGEGKGDNWWCVVYPPLCFVNKNSSQEQNIVYQSKLIEIIKKFFD